MEEQFIIKQAEFITSAGADGRYPDPLPCEIAVVGKSNVGKSSMINRLTNNRKLAKTSSQPGKTRLINFFLLNRSFYLVDLPGYGFAKASKEEQKSWGALLDRYLSSGRVKHLLMLIDIRHEPTRDDLQMFRYLIYFQSTFQLSDGSAVGLSIGKYFTPVLGRSLAEEGGLQPEILVELDEETRANIYGDLVEPKDDPQIQAAVKALQGN